MYWLMENLATILVGLALAGLVGLVLWSMRRRRQAGKSPCSCGCANCGQCGSCHGGK